MSGLGGAAAPVSAAEICPNMVILAQRVLALEATVHSAIENFANNPQPLDEPRQERMNGAVSHRVPDYRQRDLRIGHLATKSVFTHVGAKNLTFPLLVEFAGTIDPGAEMLSVEVDKSLLVFANLGGQFGPDLRRRNHLPAYMR